MISFRRILPYLLPHWARDDEADGAFAWILAALTDIQLRRARTGVEYRFPSRASPSALELIGRYRLLPRGRAETDVAYVARLQAWRYPRGHRVRGNAFALINQIQTYFGGSFALYGIDRSGNKRALSAAGATSYSYGNTWTWDSIAATQWARQWIAIDGSTIFDVTTALGTDTLWGGAWGIKGYCVGLTECEPSDWIRVRSLFQGQHRWLPAGMQGEWIVVSITGSDLTPDAAYAKWGEISGANYVPSRDGDFRYIAIRSALLDYAGDTDWTNQAVTALGTFDGTATSFPASITMPDGSEYVGSDADYPETITLIDDGSDVTAIETPLQELADRTAVLVPDIQAFTGNGTWTRPAETLYADVVVVGPGGDGGDGSDHNGCVGGGGGGAGDVLFTRISDAPATLTITVPAGGSGNPTTVVGTGISLSAAAGGDGGDASGPTPGTGGTGADGIDGGTGGTKVALGTGNPGAAGDDGESLGAGGAGGAGGDTTSGASGGAAGSGYGAGGGGGGGGGSSGSFGAGGGGGGAGGYGSTSVAVVGGDGGDYSGGSSTGGTGGAGASGYVVITAWRGVDVL